MKYKCPHCSAQNSCQDGYILYNDVQCKSCRKVFRLADADHTKGIFGRMRDTFKRSPFSAFDSPFTCCPFCYSRIYYDPPSSDGSIFLPSVCYSCHKDLPGPYNDEDNNVYYEVNYDPFPDKTNKPFQPVVEKPINEQKLVEQKIFKEEEISKEELVHKCIQMYKIQKKKNGGKDLTEAQFVELLNKIN